MKLIPIILSGGSGSRLWPLSREQHPKPFLRLSDGLSLLQKAFLLALNLSNSEEIFTVTNRELFFKTRDDFLELDPQNTKVSYLLEPFGKNTAAAIASAAICVAEKYGEDAVMLILAADHLISDHDRFYQAVAEATKFAELGMIVTFGIKPSSSETAYGYMQVSGNQVVKFIEKPSQDKANTFFNSSDYYWNSGMFCFKAGAILREMKRHCPEILNSVQVCIEASKKLGENYLELDSNSFSLVPDVSIDYALMEKSDQVVVIPCDIGWSDVGSWTSFATVGDVDSNGNFVEAEAFLHDTHNCILRGGQRLIATAGVSDLIIVDTPDALLVAARSCAQDVKLIYGYLKEIGHDSYKTHRHVKRPWGSYTVLEEGDRFKIKRIIVKPGAKLSLQTHQHRSEHWIVVSGNAKVFNDGREFIIDTNESTYISPGHRHRLENPGLDDLILIEVQSGDYLGEDDIIRFDDIYGRM